MSYDPSIQKYDGNPVYNAQPISNSSPYVVGTVAQPAYGQPTYGQPTYGQPVTNYAQPSNGHNIETQPQLYNNSNAVHRPYPTRGRWGDSICDWPLNIFPSCYCVCCICCGMWIAAQMGQKTGFSSFWTVWSTFCILCLIGFILQIIFGGAIIYWLPAIFAFVYAIALRVHIAQKEQITECGSNPCLGEFCVGFWCWYCSVTQMARHLYGYTKVLDGDGDIYRPDNYGPVQQV